MAKLKGKSKAAAATAATANAKGASGGNTTIADPAPSFEPVEEISIEAAAENAALLDGESKGAVDNNKEEETQNGGLSEPEEIEDEGVEEEEEETKDGLDAKLEEEVDDVEEAKDGLDDKSEEDSDDDDDEVDDKSDEGNEPEEDAKEEIGVVVPVGTDVVPEGGKMVNNGGKVEGEMKVEEEKDYKKDVAKGEHTPNKKLKRMKRRKKKTASARVAAAAVPNVAGKTPGSADRQGAAAAELKMGDGMGLIFMCNAKTKQDCFQYKVLGLPASKKDMVAKIYKGMRLFLFDIDLKLMYGIYKAASPGGYNIEPKAFKSAFPAQVRFRVLNDCLPLPQEKFKAAIKENYYGKNKFDFQLSSEQVKKLCKLFQTAGKIPKTKISRELLIAEPELPPPARGRRKTRKAIREEPQRTSSAHGHLKNREVIRAEPERTSSARGRKRIREVTRGEPEPISSRGRKTFRHERGRGRRDDRIPRSGDHHRYARREDYPLPRGGEHLYATRREVYPSPPPPGSLAMPPPLPAYAYGRQGDEYYYRRDPPPPQLLDPRDYRRDLPRDYQRAVELEARPRQPVEYRDAYSSMYREPIPYDEKLYMASASYAAPSAAGLARSAYAPPAPSAYAPPAASLAPSAYAPSVASLASSTTYDPSSSLYYRY